MSTFIPAQRKAMRGFSERDGKVFAVVSNMQGQIKEFEVDAVQRQQITEWVLDPQMMVQEITSLDANHRELLLTGIDQAEWDAMFGEDN